MLQAPEDEPGRGRGPGCIGHRVVSGAGRLSRDAPFNRGLSRSGYCPPLDLLLLAEETVDFGLQLRGAGIVPICRCLPEFDKPLDQEILHLSNPGPFFGRQ